MSGDPYFERRPYVRPDPRDRQIEILRRALAWHGDLSRMATTREEWQREIDDAIVWVKANPEPGRPSFPSIPWGGRSIEEARS